jgi:hypothetical protein
MLSSPVSRVHALAAGGRRRAEARAHLVRGQHAHRALHGDIELGARPVDQVHRAPQGQRRVARVARAHLPLALLHRVRHLPGAHLEGGTGREVEAELASLGPEPEAVLAAVVVEGRALLALLEERAVHEAQARSVRLDRARHHAALPPGAHHDPAAAGALEHLDGRVRLHQRDVVVDRPRSRGRGRRHRMRRRRRAGEQDQRCGGDGGTRHRAQDTAVTSRAPSRRPPQSRRRA